MGKKEGKARNEAAGNRKVHLAGEEWWHEGPRLQFHHKHMKEELPLPQKGRASTDLPDGHRKLQNSRKWEAGANRLFPSLIFSELEYRKGRPTFPFSWVPRGCPTPSSSAHLSWGVTSLGGFLRYCLKRNSKAWPMVLMTS